MVRGQLTATDEDTAIEVQVTYPAPLKGAKQENTLALVKSFAHFLGRLESKNLDIQLVVMLFMKGMLGLVDRITRDIENHDSFIMQVHFLTEKRGKQKPKFRFSKN